MKSNLKRICLLLASASLVACGGGGSDSTTTTPSVVDKYVGEWSNTLCNPVDAGVYVKVYVTFAKTGTSTMSADTRFDRYTNSACTGTPTLLRGTLVYNFVGTKNVNQVVADKVTYVAAGGGTTYRDLMYVQNNFIYTGVTTLDTDLFPIALGQYASFERK